MTTMGRHLPACVALALLVAACGQHLVRHTPTLTLLTRDGCMMTDALRVNLEAAIRSLGSSATYAVVDLGTLAPTDPRVAYPTPTLLADGRDLFGLPEPVPPFPEPT
jgi:hypothetical protein